MKNLKLRAVALLMLISLLVSLAVVPSSAAGQPSKYSSTSNSGERDVVCTTLAGTTAAGYYTGSYAFDTLSQMSKDTVFQSLRTLMTSTHKKVTSYDNCRDYATKTDCENENGKIIMLYSSYEATYSEYNGGNGWNREHVWPKSLGGDNTSGGGADLHHIRPDENKTNSNRGNKKFGNVSGGSTSTGNLSGTVGGTYSGSFFEPNDNAKGDVARIVLYMWVRWGSSWGCDSVTEVFQSVDVLLEWCALDPVDTWEMGRNEVVYAIQGNRNVFIDYPEYAWLIFGKTVPTNMQTPSGKAASGSVGGGDVGGGDVGGGDTVCQHKNTVIKNAQAATCGKNGYTGDTYCNDCKATVQKGTAILATGNHVFGEWQPDTNGYEKRSCTVCGYSQSRYPGAVEDCKHTKGFYTANYVAPTCTEDGYSGDDYCSECHEIMVSGVILQAEGHVFGEAEVIVSATAEKSGLERRVCTLCGEESVSTVPIASNGSTENTVVTVACIGGGAITVGAILFFLLRKRLF